MPLTRIGHRECNPESASQAWKIVSFNGGWQLQNKYAGSGAAYSQCLDKGLDTADSNLWALWHQRLDPCMDSTDDDRGQQTLYIEQRPSDSKWVIWVYQTNFISPKRGLLDNGRDRFTAMSSTNPMAFEITRSRTYHHSAASHHPNRDRRGTVAYLFDNSLNQQPGRR